MKHPLTSIQLSNLPSITFFVFSLVIIPSLCQQFVTPLALQDDQPEQLRVLQISTKLQDLPTTQQTHENKFMDRQIQITTQQTFTYSSSVLSPIFVLEKQWCHSHEGTVEINKLEDIYYHDSFMANHQGQNSNNPLSNGSSRLNPNFANSPLADPLSLSQQHTWVYNKKYTILYKISSSLKIDAYKVKQQSISKKIQSLQQNKQITSTLLDQQQTRTQKAITHIASIQLLTGQQQRYRFFNQCSQQADVLPILGKNSQKLYVFVCNAIFMIQCQSVLAKHQVLYEFGHMSGNKQVDKTFMGVEVKTVNEYIFWLSQSQGVKIYGIAIDGRLDYVDSLKVPLRQQQTSTSKKNNKIINNRPPKLCSLQYINGLLYVLTLNQGIYIYERLSAYHFELVSYLQYLAEMPKVNKQIIVKSDRMVIWSQSKKWQFVTQINIKHRRSGSSQSSLKNNQGTQISNDLSYSLNRYFKGYKSISQIKIINLNPSNIQSRTQQPLNKHPKTQQNPEQKLLLIVSQKGIQLYPLNKDPRQMSMMMNGVVNSHVGRDIRNVYEVQDGVWVFQAFRESLVQVQEDSDTRDDEITNGEESLFGVQSTEVETYLVLMNTRYPSIECRFQQQGTYTLFVQQQLTPNLTSVMPLKTHNTPTTQSPTTTIPLHYQPHFYHRLSIKVTHQLSIEYITILISILSIAFLVAIIALLIFWRQNKLTLIDQLVVQIRKLHQSKLRSVEFEESSPQKAVERKWDQLREEIEGEISYKVDNTEDNPHYDNNLMSQRNFYRSDQKEAKEELQSKYAYISPSKNISTSPKLQKPIQSKPKIIDPVLDDLSPQSRGNRKATNNLYNDRQQLQVSQQIRKSLKSDLQVSHQQIVIQSPSVDKKLNPFGHELEQNQFEQLNFGATLEEQLGEIQVNTSILDDDYSQRDKEQLLENQHKEQQSRDCHEK